jgi:hypothetical protein
MIRKVIRLIYSSPSENENFLISQHRKNTALPKDFCEGQMNSQSFDATIKIPPEIVSHARRIRCPSTTGNRVHPRLSRPSPPRKPITKPSPYHRIRNLHPPKPVSPANPRLIDYPLANAAIGSGTIRSVSSGPQNTDNP